MSGEQWHLESSTTPALWEALRRALPLEPKYRITKVYEEIYPIVAARVASAAAEEREGWASWLESWLSAVGPEPPTVDAVLAWLKADVHPWGASALLDAAPAGGES